MTMLIITSVTQNLSDGLRSVVMASAGRELWLAEFPLADKLNSVF